MRRVAMRALSKPRKPFASPDTLRRAFSALARLGQHVGWTWRPAGQSAGDAIGLPRCGECRPGRVYLVGAGSGDVELLTLKAARLLQQADAVVYDRLVGDEVLALVPAGRERYYVGKARGRHSMAQAEIGALLVDLARQGKAVVRLKGGDPGVFGRMGEELAALAEAGVPAHIVPGITAASAACASMGIPLTDRGHAQQLRFITAQLCRECPGLGRAGSPRRDPGVLHGPGQGRGHLRRPARCRAARRLADHAGGQRQPARPGGADRHPGRYAGAPRGRSLAITLPDRGGQRGAHGRDQPGGHGPDRGQPVPGLTSPASPGQSLSFRVASRVSSAACQEAASAAGS